jgi:hypothetical protein
MVNLLTAGTEGMRNSASIDGAEALLDSGFIDGTEALSISVFDQWYRLTDDTRCWLLHRPCCRGIIEGAGVAGVAGGGVVRSARCRCLGCCRWLVGYQSWPVTRSASTWLKINVSKGDKTMSLKTSEEGFFRR